MNAIEASGLAKTYPGGVEAVKGVDFAVEAGEVFGVLGPNGAGKSTLVGMLTTTVRPTAGWARVAGYDVASRPLQARAASSVVFQEPVVDGTLTGRANLELHVRLWGMPEPQARRRLDELIGALGLGELVDRPVDTYSGGQRRRLEVARALLSEPQVLFLDEPTVGLDPRIRNELLEVIAGLRTRDELTILLTTHYLEEAQRLCDRVAIVHDGALVALDSPAALLRALGEQIVEVRVLGDPDDALRRLRARGIAGDGAFAVGANLTIPLREHSAPEALAAMEEERIPVAEVATRAPSLDDVYLQITAN
ncbi:MAG TPA: ABC transporter ATP-binding protein [Solirubrobacteraceae bacterium]|jgi:ABC-2 type transport system ATP-binding protein